MKSGKAAFVGEDGLTPAMALFACERNSEGVSCIIWDYVSNGWNCLERTQYKNSEQREDGSFQMCTMQRRAKTQEWSGDTHT